MTRVALDGSLQKALEGGTPVEAVDPSTQQVYYVISAEQYGKIRALISDDFDPREAYPFIEKVMAEDDALDPLLDSYQ